MIRTGSHKFIFTRVGRWQVWRKEFSGEICVERSTCTCHHYVLGNCADEGR